MKSEFRIDWKQMSFETRNRLEKCFDTIIDYLNNNYKDNQIIDDDYLKPYIKMPTFDFNEVWVEGISYNASTIIGVDDAQTITKLDLYIDTMLNIFQYDVYVLLSNSDTSEEAPVFDDFSESRSFKFSDYYSFLRALAFDEWVFNEDIKSELAAICNQISTESQYWLPFV